MLATVAGFVAGANDYAGLAAMSLTSHTMHQELKPIFYETVIWNPVFHDRLHRPQEEREKPGGSELRHIRYVSLHNLIANHRNRLL